MHDIVHTASASPTAAVCESMALFGASPERGELDSRVIWDEDDAIHALGEAIRIIVDGITVDGTQMADEREALLWGFVNCLHSQVTRLDRTVDRIAPEMRDLERAQDGTEVKAHELETLTDRAQNLGDRRDAFEKLRDTRRRRLPRRDRRRLAPAPRIAHESDRPAHLGRDRRPRLPPRTAGPRDTRAPAGRDARRHHRRQDRRTDVDEVWTTLDRARAKYGDMVLLHGGGPGYEKIAASWADARGVDQVVCRPDWSAHGKAAPFRQERRAVEPAAGRRHRLSRLRHHRQPDRQGPAARHPGHDRHHVTATLPLPPRAGRCLGGDRLSLFRRATRRALRRGASHRRRFALPTAAPTVAVAHLRCASGSALARHRPPLAPLDATRRPSLRTGEVNELRRTSRG